MKLSIHIIVLLITLTELATGCDMSGGGLLGHSSSTSASTSDSEAYYSWVTQDYFELYYFEYSNVEVDEGTVGHGPTPMSGADQQCQVSFAGSIQSVNYQTSGAEAGKLELQVGLLPSGRFPIVSGLAYQPEAEAGTQRVEFNCSVDAVSADGTTESLFCQPAYPLAPLSSATSNPGATWAFSSVSLSDNDQASGTSCSHALMVATTVESGGSQDITTPIAPVEVLGFPALL